MTLNLKTLEPEDFCKFCSLTSESSGSNAAAVFAPSGLVSKVRGRVLSEDAGADGLIR